MAVVFHISLIITHTSQDHLETLKKIKNTEANNRFVFPYDKPVSPRASNLKLCLPLPLQTFVRTPMYTLYVTIISITAVGSELKLE